MTDIAHALVVTSDNFATAVLEQSERVPVLVDFWAAWCAPCQMLMPVLAKLAEEYAGKFVLAKLNADEQPRLAAEYGVRSLPTLKLFRRGQVVEELLGAQPESVLRALLDRHLERPSDAVRAEALRLSAAQQHAAAIDLLQTALAAEPEHYPIHQDLAQVLIAAGRYAEAEALLHKLPANIQAEETTRQALARLAFGRIIETAPDAASLLARLAADENDLNARYQLSAHQVLQGEYSAALENLLLLMRKSRQFGDDAGRKGMLAVFALLGDDPLVSRYRSKLSALLY